MRYPVDLLPCDSGFNVRFRDCDKITAHGQTRTEALEKAQAALIEVVEIFFTKRKCVPGPSPIECDFVELPLSVSAKILLLNEVISQGITNTELANRLGLPRQEITRIFNLSHSTKIDTIQKALSVLGKRLELHLH